MSESPAEGAGPTAAIVGNGRSGTNWLLTMVDASRRTHCRSEPNDIPTSLIHHLPEPGSADFDARLPAAWREFVAATRSSIGERDHAPPVAKDFYHAWANRLGLAELHRRPGLNRLRRRAFRSRYRAERPLSPLLGSRRRLRASPCVMKLNDFHAAHLDAVWGIDPDLRIVHIVRHPGGYLDSAVRRHFGTLSAVELDREDELYRGYLEAGRRAGIYAEDVLEDLGDGPLGVVMRFWSANNAATAGLGAGSSNYLRVIYEALAADPVGVAQQVFGHLDLPVDDTVLAQIDAGKGENVWGDLSGSSSETARRWAGRLSEDHLALVDHELARSSLGDWWDA